MLRLRSAVLNGYVEVAQSVGLNPHPLMRVAGIDPASFAATQGWIAAKSVSELLELSASQSGRDDFGLRMSLDRGVSNLGPVGLIAREEPDVRSALGIVLRHMKLHNEAIRLDLTESRGLATIRVTPMDGMILGQQSVDLVVASTLRVLCDFLPDEWLPISTCFTHAAPADDEMHIRIFGPSIHFDHEIDGIIIATSDLDSPNRLSNPVLRPFAQEYLGLLAPPENPSLAGQVRDLIATLLPTEHCSVTRIARSLGMDRRTLHRRLAQSGETYSSILDAVRRDQATMSIERGDRSLTEISVELGFSELSAFSRWFRQQFGCSPKAWPQQ
jgi:AraC-like DNA-binding protein